MRVPLLKSLLEDSFTLQDAVVLYKALPEKVRYGRFEVKSNQFNHIDFVFGRNAKEEVYDHLLEVLKKKRT